jgi:hypothetical protein
MRHGGTTITAATAPPAADAVQVMLDLLVREIQAL